MASGYDTHALQIGIDIGGTFTDFVIYDPTTRQVESFKLLSTPSNPSEAVLAGIQQIIQSKFTRGLTIIHGSTVATNALLERKGAQVASVTTRGFKDIEQIGRQNRPELYNLAGQLPSPLTSPEYRFEVDERVSASGDVLVPLDTVQVNQLVTRIVECKAEAVAICLVFSFLQPRHEQIIAQRLRDAGLFTSVSSEVLPEFREYERMSTTLVNAYVTPVLDNYLGMLEQSLRSSTYQNRKPHLRIMQSNGGVIEASEARRQGVNCILSGPAGGVVGAQFIGAQSLEGPLNLLTFDMGGTSTDVSLIAGKPHITTEAVISGLPVRIPVLDIHTIGAGGGSIAYPDAGGALRVGPQSAGADPGPACYGFADPLATPQRIFATVTDANLFLGRLIAEEFLGGRMPLKEANARWALEGLASNLNLDLITTALGIIEVVNAHMEHALRVISVERGYDPRDFKLLSFGGAGGLHAVDLARRLGIPQVIFPPQASTLSALGMVAAEVVKDYSKTIMLPGEVAIEKINEHFNFLIERAEAEMKKEGVAKETIMFNLSLDMRYKGQSYEINLPWLDHKESFLSNFHNTHHETYGYSNPFSPVEIVNIRLRAEGLPPEIELPQFPPSNSEPESTALRGYRQITFSGQGNKPVIINVPCFYWEKLRPGNRLSGPALVIRNDTTILVNIGDSGYLDKHMNLIVLATQQIKLGNTNHLS